MIKYKVLKYYSPEELEKKMNELAQDGYIFKSAFGCGTHTYSSGWVIMEKEEGQHD